MIRRLRRWLALPARERRSFLLLSILQPALSLALRLFGYKRMRSWLERHSHHPAAHAASGSEWDEAQRLAELARTAGRHGLSETTCLRQSLAVYWLLRRRGLQPELKLGVGRIGHNAPDMHAWVELEGRALAQPGLRHAAFSASTASRQAETAATTSGKHV